MARLRPIVSTHEHWENTPGADIPTSRYERESTGLAIPAIPTSTPISVPLTGFPHVGTVVGVSTLSTAAGGIICADLSSVNTGS